MRVLGVDPGSRYTGLGVVEHTDGDIRLIASKRVVLKSRTLSQRLAQIYQEVADIIDQYKPQVAAIEQVFFSKNAHSALILGQARGSAICAAVNAHCNIYEYSALQIKRAVVGTGGAKKEQVQHMMRVLLGLHQSPSTDEADALACALCYINTTQVEQKIHGALNLDINR